MNLSRSVLGLAIGATLCTALFSGAAIYINLVEHPARLEAGTSAADLEWP